MMTSRSNETAATKPPAVRQQTPCTAPAKRGNNGAFGRAGGNRIRQSVSSGRKRRGASLPAAVHATVRIALVLGLFSCRNLTAATNQPIAVWDTSVRITSGLGFRENVLRSRIATESSAFALNSADATFIRLAESGRLLTLFLLGEDTRYFDAPSINYEQLFSGSAQFTTPVGVRGEFGSYANYLYQHQILDVSETEANLRRVLVNGHGITARPHWKQTLGDGWAAQLEGVVLRQFYEGELDDFWEGSGRLSVIRTFGHRSEFSAGYQLLHRNYDTRQQLDGSGLAIANTRLVYWQHEVSGQWRHHWDEAQQWRTTSKLGYLLNRDNGSGFFDYDRLLFNQQLRWRNAAWEIKTNARGGWYFYQWQRVGPELRERSYISLDLRVERRLGKLWLAYATAEHEWNLSNDPLDEYNGWMAGAGIGVEF